MFFEENKYNSLLSLVNEYLEGYTNINESKLKRRIENAYKTDNITGEEYDHLIGLLE